MVGVTGTCPYGVAACWGGAYEALRSRTGVRGVDPLPDADASTATLYIEDGRLPVPELWEHEFRRMVNGTYALRGVEVSLAGTVSARSGELVLDAEVAGVPVRLAPLIRTDKVQRDRARRAAPARRTR